MVLQEYVIATVEAHNDRGWSAPSDDNDDTVNDAKIQTEPKTMTTLPRRGSDSSSSQIQVEWDALVSPNNGDSTILSYNLQWDAGTSGVTWTDLIGHTTAYTSLSYTISTGIVPGNFYSFRVKSRNKYGSSPDYSPVVSFIAASQPE